MNQVRLFSSFARQIIRTRPQQKLYYSSKYRLQSSVGIIFRCHSQNQFKSIDDLISNQKSILKAQVLMTQRAGYERDVNAYNIVFPGGQADIGQSDFQACKRQLKEQINLTVDQDCIYMGQVPKNFYYAKKRDRYVFITCHIWVMKWKNTFQPKLNKDQLIDYRWVPFSELADPNNLTIFNAKQFAFFRRIAWKFLRNSVSQNLEVVNFPGLNVGMNRDLWGLTLWLVNYIVQMSQENLKTSAETQQQKNLIKDIDITSQRLKFIQVKFKKQYIIGIPMVWMAKLWHYRYRVNQFTYQRSPYKSSKPSIIGILVIMSICLIYFILCLR